MPRNLKIAEITRSIHGEMPYQGTPVCIVRLHGCNNSCSWCDAEKALKGESKILTVGKTAAEASKAGFKHVLITGGEPLCQKDTPVLIRTLLKRGFTVTVETNGSLDVSKIPRGATVVMDIKLPSAKSRAKSDMTNIKRLKKTDVLKFVVADARDYSTAKRILKSHKRDLVCSVVFSPVYGKISPVKLASLLMKDRLPFRMQLQLHKVLGMP